MIKDLLRETKKSILFLGEVSILNISESFLNIELTATGVSVAWIREDDDCQRGY